MRNVITIAREDFKKLLSNTIGFVVALGLIFMPCMYAWFNIAGSWDPYSNTGELKVAVANNDEGFSSDYLPMDVFVGNNVESNLRSNNQFQWVFVTEDEAIEGVKSGAYYAAIVIPASFSADLMSFVVDQSQTAQITYYTNEKINAIAPKVTNKGASALQQSISTSFTETVSETVLRLASTGIDVAQSDTVTQLMTTLKETAESTSASLTDLASSLRSLNSVINSSSSLIEAAGTMSSDEGSGHLTSLLDILSGQIGGLRTNLQDLKEMAEELSAPSEVIAIMDELLNTTDALQTANDQAYTLAQAGTTAIDSMKETLAAVGTQIDSLSSDLAAAADKLDASAQELTEVEERVQAFLDGESLETAESIIGDDAAALAEVIASPVTLQREAIYPVENNGSSMASFYTALSIWVGATLLVATMKTGVSRKRIERMQRERGRKVRLWELYLGRYVIFGTISLLQTTMICLGELFFLGIQCVHPVLFMLTSWVISIVLSLLIYTLTISFGSIGKALAVILLVMQVAGSGGTFPIEMMGTFFNFVYPFLPFRYAISALQECIAGVCGYYLSAYLFLLFLFIVPVCLALGMLLRAPMVRVNAWLVEKLEETGVME